MNTRNIHPMTFTRCTYTLCGIAYHYFAGLFCKLSQVSEKQYTTRMHYDGTMQQTERSGLRDEALFFFAVQHVARAATWRFVHINCVDALNARFAAEILYIYNYDIPAKSNIVVLYIKIYARERERVNVA